MIKDQRHDFTIRNERLQTIIDNILDLIIEMDLLGKFIYISPQSFQILGYTPEELIGRKSIDLIHPDDIESFISIMRNPPEYNKSHSIEFRMKQKSGSFINVSAKGVIINQNDMSKHIIVVRDISYKIISEKKVQESEQQYHKILESIGDPIQVVDNNLHIIMLNSAFKEWINRFGITNEIFGKSPFEIFPFLPKTVADEYEYVFESGQTLTTEECIIFDDKKIYTEARKIPILTNGKVTQIITILRDITEKKKSDRYFEESEEKFRNIANQSFMSIAIIQNGLIKYFNKRIPEINGYSSIEIKNWKPFEFLKIIHPDDREFVFKQSKKKESGDKDVFDQYKYRLVRKTGEIRWIELFSKNISYRGKPAILAMSIDITDKILAEQKLQESEEKYRNLFKDSPYMIFLIDLKGKILDLNQIAIDNITYTKEDMIGTNFSTFDIMRNKNLSSLPEMFKKILKNKFLDPFEIHVNSPKIKPEWLKIQAKIVYIGEKKHIQVIVEDISGKKKAEKMLKESEKKFQNIIENTKDAIVIIGLNGKLQYISPQLSTMLKGKDIKNTSRFFHDIHKDDVQNLIKLFKNVMKEKTQLDETLEFRILDKEKNYIWLASTSNNYYDDEGNTIGFITTLKDITDRKIAEQRLKESGEKYKLITENSNDLIQLLDKELKIEFFNEVTHLNVLGYSKEELYRKTEIYLYHPDDYREINSFMAKTFKAGEGFRESRLRHKNGNYIWFEVRIKCFKDEQEQHKYLFVYRDIDERKKAEKNLKDSEARYRLITENSNDLIRVLNEDFKIEFFNEVTHLNVLGYSKEEMLKYIDVYFNHPDDYRKIIRYMLKVFKTGEGFRESRIRHKNGNYIWFEVRIKCFKDEQEQQKYLFVYRDIDERKKAEKNLKESEKMYRNLYENSPIAIVISDDKGHILEQNQASEKIFGYQNDELYGKNFQDFDIFNPNQIQLIKNTYKGFLQGFKSKQREMMIKNKDGKAVWINWQLSIIRQNELNLVETMAHDITEEKKAKLLIEEENKKLLELNKMKNELVSRVSHELKTPLNSVYGGTQILLNLHKKDLNPESLEFVEMIHKGGKRLKKLIESLLDTSRIDSNKLFLDLQEHNLTEIIKECVEDMMYFAGERKIEICLDLLDNVVCEIDRLRIEQVITNLLSNAIKNTQPSGAVKVTLSTQGNSIYVTVEDTGVGLTIDEIDKLFNKFGKIERYGKRLNVDIEGSGLGLFITKEIIDLHNGSIWVESEGKNKGSKFTFKLDKYHVL